MKVLFVSRGKDDNSISPIVKAQAESLMDIEIEFFQIRGNGVFGYLNSVRALKKHFSNNSYVVIHSHYSLSAIVSTLAGAKNHMVSLMGSDVKSKGWYKYILFLFYKFFWDMTMVKSLDMKRSLGFQNVVVIPNGVNINMFKPQDQKMAIQKLGWNPLKKHILFPSDPMRREKNIQLLNNAIDLLDIDIIVHPLMGLPQNATVDYYNAADVVVLSSLWEGSPNAIKEAMACNRPIVSTNVGDVSILLDDVKGCFISDFNPEDMANKILLALNNQSTNGLDKIISIGLTSNIVANRLIVAYKELIK